MKWLKRDSKWHKGFAWFPVQYQSNFGEDCWAWLEPIYYTYNENRAAIGISPWVYATAESLTKLHHEKLPA